ncbi:MAG TPA: DUF86 domain-containing protein, partial [Candidatus Brocadiia bacterium]|nr:DUF86 domain-containing protein [Candidatus Brocadiia bacterium]
GGVLDGYRRPFHNEGVQNKVAAMRNLLARAYFGASLPLVWDVVQNKLEPLDRVCRGLAGRV